MNRARSVLITGGAGGIGKASAQCFAREGYRIFLLDVSDTVQAVAESLARYPGQVQGLQVDVAAEAELVEAARRAREESEGVIDVLVNCAGISPKGDGGPIPLPAITTEQWERVHRINVTAPFILCRELMPAMAAQGWGRVINIVSRAARTYVPVSGLEYHSSKTALMGLTRALAGAYGGHGITVNSVAPGRIATAMAAATHPELLEQTLKMIPARRFGQPEEIGELLVFMASDKAGYINGACIDANGGIYMT